MPFPHHLIPPHISYPASPMRKARRYRGVRQRHWGSWVSEIRHPISKIRVWLGTFPSADEAAIAYDEAARILCGSQAKTNFPLPSPSTSSPLSSSFHSPNGDNHSTALSPAIKQKLNRARVMDDSVRPIEGTSEPFYGHASALTEGLDVPGGLISNQTIGAAWSTLGSNSSFLMRAMYDEMVGSSTSTSNGTMALDLSSTLSPGMAPVISTMTAGGSYSTYTQQVFDSFSCGKAGAVSSPLSAADDPATGSSASVSSDIPQATGSAASQYAIPKPVKACWECGELQQYNSGISQYEYNMNPAESCTADDLLLCDLIHDFCQSTSLNNFSVDSLPELFLPFSLVYEQQSQ